MEIILRFNLVHFPAFTKCNNRKMKGNQREEHLLKHNSINSSLIYLAYFDFPFVTIKMTHMLIGLESVLIEFDK